MAIELFADYSDYEAEYGSESNEDAVNAKLEAASAYLWGKLTRYKPDYVAGQNEAYDIQLREACLEMVANALSYTRAPYGASQYTQSGNGYSESMSWGNPSGRLFLTKDQLHELGLCGGTQIACIKPEIRNSDGDAVEW